MKRFLFFIFALLLASCVLPPRGQQQALLAGPELNGWQQTGEGKWRLLNGELAALKKTGNTMLFTDAAYQNYRLRLEFWVDNESNSGVFIHCDNQAEISPFSCYEVNIWDNHPKQEFRTGAIVFHVSPPLAQINSVGRWNVMEITADGNNVKVQLNGITTAIIEEGSRSSGFIGLQRFNGGEVRFRNVVLTPIINK